MGWDKSNLMLNRIPQLPPQDRSVFPSVFQAMGTSSLPPTHSLAKSGPGWLRALRLAPLDFNANLLIARFASVLNQHILTGKAAVIGSRQVLQALSASLQVNVTSSIQAPRLHSRFRGGVVPRLKPPRGLTSSCLSVITIAVLRGSIPISRFRPLSLVAFACTLEDHGT